MALEDLHKIKPGPGNWPNLYRGGEGMGMSALLDIIDVELNSDSAAGRDYDTYQRGRRSPRGAAMIVFRQHVTRVISRNSDTFDPLWYTGWPTDMLTYALLSRWISVEG